MQVIESISVHLSNLQKVKQSVPLNDPGRLLRHQLGDVRE